MAGSRILKGLLAIGCVAAVVNTASAAGRHRAAAAAPLPHDGPFGIAMGEPIRDIGPVETIEPGLYHVVAPPRTNPDFNNVDVMAYPDTGVCVILAMGPKLRLDPKGLEVRESVDRIVAALAQKYGPFDRKDDHCNDTNLCADYWVAELNQNNASYEYSWDFSKAARADNIYQMSVSVQPDDAVTSYAEISYTSANRDGCAAAIKRGQAAGL